MVLHLPMRYEDETTLLPIADAIHRAGLGLAVQVEGVVTSNEVSFRPRQPAGGQDRRRYRRADAALSEFLRQPGPADGRRHLPARARRTARRWLLRRGDGPSHRAPGDAGRGAAR
ncbi:hypothetical protein ACU4GD_35480 [Cupriavidus basilensis]